MPPRPSSQTIPVTPIFSHSYLLRYVRVFPPFHASDEYITCLSIRSTLGICIPCVLYHTSLPQLPNSAPLVHVWAHPSPFPFPQSQSQSSHPPPVPFSIPWSPSLPFQPLPLLLLLLLRATLPFHLPHPVCLDRLLLPHITHPALHSIFPQLQRASSRLPSILPTTPTLIPASTSASTSASICSHQQNFSPPAAFPPSYSTADIRGSIFPTNTDKYHTFPRVPPAWQACHFYSLPACKHTVSTWCLGSSIAPSGLNHLSSQPLDRAFPRARDRTQASPPTNSRHRLSPQTPVSTLFA
ncbi:uncharacterized protein LY79DRAFT_42037 [Colletotrichum navitas]|uniref:Uncharacterized protein n=1 Tax=Colletotrichum navitas TaxID=681940 RepID=A0AAD8PMH3_9PEZI|nr:uncharacterized protein LY79DRAFT_42037 [Colletotrichum navitas]KAK1572822.1 hypothetical protein LY79DRAFT_42037 [Colletotrichum navitas]